MITPEFVRKRVPMEELQILLDDRSAQPSDQPQKAIFAVFYGYEVEQCSKMQVFRALYDTEKWVGGEEIPDKKVLDAWAKNVEELCKYCGIRKDQVSDQTGPSGAINRGRGSCWQRLIARLRLVMLSKCGKRKYIGWGDTGQAV